MDPDFSEGASVVGGADVDPARLDVDQAPMPSRRLVAQHGAGAGVEQCSHQASPDAQHRMADGIHAGVNAMQPPFRDPPREDRPADPAPQQLLAAGDPILTLRQARDLN